MHSNRRVCYTVHPFVIYFQIWGKFLLSHTFSHSVIIMYSHTSLFLYIFGHVSNRLTLFFSSPHLLFLVACKVVTYPTCRTNEAAQQCLSRECLHIQQHSHTLLLSEVRELYLVVGSTTVWGCTLNCLSCSQLLCGWLVVSVWGHIKVLFVVVCLYYTTWGSGSTRDREADFWPES